MNREREAPALCADTNDRAQPGCTSWYVLLMYVGMGNTDQNKAQRRDEEHSSIRDHLSDLEFQQVLFLIVFITCICHTVQHGKDWTIAKSELVKFHQG